MEEGITAVVMIIFVGLIVGVVVYLLATGKIDLTEDDKNSPTRVLDDLFYVKIGSGYLNNPGTAGDQVSVVDKSNAAVFVTLRASNNSYLFLYTTKCSSSNNYAPKHTNNKLSYLTVSGTPTSTSKVIRDTWNSGTSSCALGKNSSWVLEEDNNTTYLRTNYSNSMYMSVDGNNDAQVVNGKSNATSIKLERVS